MIEFVRLRNSRAAYLRLLIAGWTAFGLFFGTQNYVRDVYFGRGANLPGYFIGWLICGYSWAALTPFISKFVKRFSLARFARNGKLGYASFVAFYLLVGAPAASIQLGVYVLITWAIGMLAGLPTAGPVEWYTRVWVLEFQTSYLVFLGLVAAITIYERLTVPAVETKAAAPRTEPETESYPRRIAVKDNGRINLVEVDTIDWIESCGNYVLLHTASRRHILRETMANLEKRLDPAEFVRVRRSAIVRSQRVGELRAEGNGEYEIRLTNGTNLSSTRRYRRNLERLLTN